MLHNNYDYKIEEALIVGARAEEVILDAIFEDFALAIPLAPSFLTLFSTPMRGNSAGHCLYTKEK